MATILRPKLTRAELEAIGADLVGKLGGQWTHGRGMCRCPVHADHSPSLSVRVGHTSLLFHCFAGCATTEILAWIRQEGPKALASAEPGPAPLRDKNDWLRARAMELWNEGRGLGGTVAEMYLHARGLPCRSDALRFHSSAPLGPARNLSFRPAMLARVTHRGRVLAVQRTYLDPVHGRRARDIGNPRRMLGHPGQGAVELCPATDTLGLAEGVETAMSAAILLDIPVWAVLGNERLPRVAIPDDVTRLILLPDSDAAGQKGASLAEAAFKREGRCIETQLPWNGLNDWNDLLRAEHRTSSSPSTGRRT